MVVSARALSCASPTDPMDGFRPNRDRRRRRRYERDVGEDAGDELDVGEVRDEQPVGGGHRELAVDQAGARSAAGSGIVVRTFCCRRTPCQPPARIRRSPVDFATGMSSRCGWAHIFNDPYSDSGFLRPRSSGS